MQIVQGRADSAEHLLSGEVMQILRISRRTLDRWIADGTLKSVKVGGTHRFLRSDVEALLNPEGGEAL